MYANYTHGRVSTNRNSEELGQSRPQGCGGKGVRADATNTRVSLPLPCWHFQHRESRGLKSLLARAGVCFPGVRVCLLCLLINTRSLCLRWSLLGIRGVWRSITRRLGVAVFPPVAPRRMQRGSVLAAACNYNGLRLWSCLSPSPLCTRFGLAFPLTPSTASRKQHRIERSDKVMKNEFLKIKKKGKTVKFVREETPVFYTQLRFIYSLVFLFTSWSITIFFLTK